MRMVVLFISKGRMAQTTSLNLLRGLESLGAHVPAFALVPSMLGVPMRGVKHSDSYFAKCANLAPNALLKQTYLHCALMVSEHFRRAFSKTVQALLKYILLGKAMPPTRIVSYVVTMFDCGTLIV